MQADWKSWLRSQKQLAAHADVISEVLDIWPICVGNWYIVIIFIYDTFSFPFCRAKPSSYPSALKGEWEHIQPCSEERREGGDSPPSLSSPPHQETRRGLSPPSLPPALRVCGSLFAQGASVSPEDGWKILIFTIESVISLRERGGSKLISAPALRLSPLVVLKIHDEPIFS